MYTKAFIFIFILLHSYIQVNTFIFLKLSTVDKISHNASVLLISMASSSEFQISREESFMNAQCESRRLRKLATGLFELKLTSKRQILVSVVAQLARNLYVFCLRRRTVVQHTSTITRFFVGGGGNAILILSSTLALSDTRMRCAQSGTQIVYRQYSIPRQYVYMSLAQCTV